jgi:hypothetical protein
VRIFSRKTRARWTLGSHQIRVFHRRSEQLVGREARRELMETLVHVLGAKASPMAALTVDKHRLSRLIVTGLRCQSPPIKVSINTFPSSLWSGRSKPYRKPTTVAQENSNSGWAQADANPGRSQPPQLSDQRQVTLASTVKSRWQPSIRSNLNTRAEMAIWLV